MYSPHKSNCRISWLHIPMLPCCWITKSLKMYRNKKKKIKAAFFGCRQIQPFISTGSFFPYVKIEPGPHPCDPVPYRWIFTIIRTKKMTRLKGTSACITMTRLLSFSIIRYFWTGCGIEYRVSDLNSVTTENDAHQLFRSITEIQHNTHKRSHLLSF